MDIKTKRRVGSYICWFCHREFPLYEGQKRKYCPDCLPKQASEAGKRGGRARKKQRLASKQNRKESRLRPGQRLEGRITNDKAEEIRHKELTTQIESIIQRARDSTIMSAEYDARKIEELFALQPISLSLPPNKWKSMPQQGANPDRLLAIDLYRQQACEHLERQGFIVLEKLGVD